jgi:DNA-binding MarR family transcriptional regulator/N-acetylglutamate synthase-like GNAT family acetyltransferase
MSVNLEVVQEISEFNRYYTNLSEVLNRHITENNLTLTALRVLTSLSADDQVTAGKLVDNLGIDGGYLSRMLKAFESDQLLSRKKSTLDGRTWYLQLTAKGRKLLDMMQETAGEQIRHLLEPVPAEQQHALAAAMKTIRHILSDETRITTEDITWRYQLQPGDAGYLIYMHGHLYAREMGYNLEFDTSVVKNFAEFMEGYNPSKDQVYLAMHGNQIVASLAVLWHSRYAAQFKWLLVHPDFRGIGIGRKLLADAISNCREKGYHKVYLYSTNLQETANNMFRKAGFRKTGEKPQGLYGKHMNEERYDMDLV